MIKINNSIKCAAVATALIGSVAMCNSSRNDYVRTLKENVKENVTPERFDELQNEANDIFSNKEQVWKNAYDSIQNANAVKSYFEAGQNINLSK